MTTDLDFASVQNKECNDSYPIASFTYLYSKELGTNPSIDETTAKALVDFISWTITWSKICSRFRIYCLA